eukprot:CAMPEP_0194279548 /NCGR_PEP_ID=MMETSP0169-20130528/13991_1 /TAXON_ID=218684 /ORGANISM="Corethron pennatum, Strain L29A3" /LENGTH=533 /DNA_ID=CAMNT_0039023985 /DNA_START=60 /DNA_END=1661 /DNA_ORIENTATION=+
MPEDPEKVETSETIESKPIELLENGQKNAAEVGTVQISETNESEPVKKMEDETKGVAETEKPEASSDIIESDPVKKVEEDEEKDVGETEKPDTSSDMIESDPVKKVEEDEKNGEAENDEQNCEVEKKDETQDELKNEKIDSKVGTESEEKADEKKNDLELVEEDKAAPDVTKDKGTIEKVEESEKKLIEDEGGNEVDNKHTDDSMDVDEEIPEDQKAGTDATTEKVATTAADVDAEKVEAVDEKDAVMTEAAEKSPKKKKEFLVVTPSRTSSRQRKSINRLSIEESTPEVNKFVIVDGSGIQLEDIDSVVANLKKIKTSSDLFMIAHQLLFKRRGKQNDIRKRVYSFSGFIPKDCKDEEKEKLRESMLTRIYRLKKNVLNDVMDMFDLPRTGLKEETSERLLKFLASPSSKHTKTKKKSEEKKRKSIEKQEKSSRKKKREVLDDEKSENDSTSEHGNDKKRKKENDVVEEESEGGPLKKKLRKWINSYLVVFKMEDVSLTHAIELGSKKFGTDLLQKSDLMKKLLKEAIYAHI